MRRGHRRESGCTMMPKTCQIVEDLEQNGLLGVSRHSIDETIAVRQAENLRRSTLVVSYWRFCCVHEGNGRVPHCLLQWTARRHPCHRTLWSPQPSHAHPVSHDYPRRVSVEKQCVHAPGMFTCLAANSGDIIQCVSLMNISTTNLRDQLCSMTATNMRWVLHVVHVQPNWRVSHFSSLSRCGQQLLRGVTSHELF